MLHRVKGLPDRIVVGKILFYLLKKTLSRLTCKMSYSIKEKTKCTNTYHTLFAFCVIKQRKQSANVRFTVWQRELRKEDYAKRTMQRERSEDGN